MWRADGTTDVLRYIWRWLKTIRPIRENRLALPEQMYFVYLGILGVLCGEDKRWIGEEAMTRTLWIVQALLAFIFLFSGASKFVMSVVEMNAQAAFPLPGLFLHFIRVRE